MFSYKHLPAIGMGKRDPVRPYVTGGLGRGIIIVYPATSLRMRILSDAYVDQHASIVEGKQL